MTDKPAIGTYDGLVSNTPMASYAYVYETGKLNRIVVVQRGLGTEECLELCKGTDA